MPSYFFQIVLLKIPITPDLNEKFVVRPADLLTRQGTSRQALFFEVMTENADQRCSTFLLPQCGQAIFSFACRTIVKILEKAFLQPWQKNSYWGMATSTLLKRNARILAP